jgi:hypothetical protein
MPIVSLSSGNNELLGMAWPDWGRIEELQVDKRGDPSQQFG